MKPVILVAMTGLLLAGCATGDHRGQPSVGVGVAIGGSAPPPTRVGGPPPWAPAHGRRAKETVRYYYYPGAGVYYNVSTRSYFYLNGGSWQVAMSLPPSVVIDSGDYVSLTLDTDRPYLFYEDHKVKYKGKNGRGHGKGRMKRQGPPF